MIREYSTTQKSLMLMKRFDKNFEYKEKKVLEGQLDI